MGASELVRVIWRRKWRVLGVALLLGAIVHIRSDASPDVYSAAAVLSVTPSAGDAGPGAAERLARSYAVLATTRAVLAKAVVDGGSRLGPSAAGDLVDASATEDGVVEVDADGPSPGGAERLASSVAAALVSTVESRQETVREEALAPVAEEVADLERQLSSRDLAADAPVRPALLARYSELNRVITQERIRPLDRLEIVSPARASSSPVTPTPARDGLSAFLGALVAFSLLAVAVEVFSDRFSTERPAEEAARITGLPVLAEIPRSGGPEVIEAFRALRTSLMFMSTSERLRTLAVVGVEAGTGKTLTALNLARESAALEVPVVLIDGDLRRPILHDRLKLARSPGLSEALQGAAVIRDIGHPSGDWLRVVTCGAAVTDPAGLFGGDSFQEALEEMTWAELVVVDTPAAGLFADALAIASQCDATLIVVDAQRSRRRAVRNLVEGLRHVSAQPIGIVLNRTDPRPTVL